MLKQASTLLFLILSLGIVMAQSQISSVNYTHAQAAAIVANVSAYVALVNQSAYLIYAPNLTQSYSELGLAMKLSNSSPSSAVLYAQMANRSAYEEYQSIRYQEWQSFPIIFGFTVLTLFLLYKFMVPIKRRR